MSQPFQHHHTRTRPSAAHSPTAPASHADTPHPPRHTTTHPGPARPAFWLTLTTIDSATLSAHDVVTPCDPPAPPMLTAGTFSNVPHNAYPCMPYAPATSPMATCDVKCHCHDTTLCRPGSTISRTSAPPSSWHHSYRLGRNHMPPYAEGTQPPCAPTTLCPSPTLATILSRQRAPSYGLPHGFAACLPTTRR